jgi:hydroxypyruvate reductase
VNSTSHNVKLVRLVSSAISRFSASSLVFDTRLSRGLSAGDAVLCWGKAALFTRAALGSIAGPSLVITPRGTDVRFLSESSSADWICEGEHPLPGAGSFAAGQALLEFFSYLGRATSGPVRRLHVFLSGGASSLAWVKPAHLSERALQERLRALLLSGLSIRQLNRERSKLCALKAGGSARLLRRLAPHVDVQVRLISDVLPYGPEVVGSGPFWGEGISHVVDADAAMCAGELARLAHQEDIPLLGLYVGWVDSADRWVARIERDVRQALSRGRSGLFIYGGEPAIRISSSAASPSGGRLTHLSLMLAHRLRDELAHGKVELLARATDGLDGASGSAGVYLHSSVARSLSAPQEIRKALRTFHTAPLLRSAGALLSPEPTGTNLQDFLLIRIADL